MKPTRALETSESTPSSMPTPARRTGQTATFLPEMRGTVVARAASRSRPSSVGKSFVASYVSSSVTSFDELAEVDGRRVLVPQVGQLVLDERVVDVRQTTVWVTRRTRVAAEAGVERPLRAQRRARAASASTSAPSPSAPTMIPPTSRKSSSSKPRIVAAGVPIADARGDGRRPLVERHGVAVDGQLDLGEPLLGVLARPLGARRSSCSRCVSVPPVTTSRPASLASRRARRRSRGPGSGSRGTHRSSRS